MTGQVSCGKRRWHNDIRPDSRGSTTNQVRLEGPQLASHQRDTKCRLKPSRVRSWELSFYSKSANRYLKLLVEMSVASSHCSSPDYTIINVVGGIH